MKNSSLPLLGAASFVMVAFLSTQVVASDEQERPTAATPSWHTPLSDPLVEAVWQKAYGEYAGATEAERNVIVARDSKEWAEKLHSMLKAIDDYMTKEEKQ